MTVYVLIKKEREMKEDEHEKQNEMCCDKHFKML